MFTKNLRYFRKSNNYSMDKLCKIYNERYNGRMNKSTLSRYENGIQEPMFTVVKNLAEIFGISADELMDDKTYEPYVPVNERVPYSEPSNIAAVIPNSKIYQIPVFESVSAGFGAYASDCVIDMLPMVIENTYDVPDTIAIKVTGDSMYPKIEDGDIIVVRKQESVDSGDVAVLLLDGDEGLVKKVTYGETWIELHSFNPEYKTRCFDDEEVLRLRVVGKVLKVVKSL